jgi:hypothetical protein
MLLLYQTIICSPKLKQDRKATLCGWVIPVRLEFLVIGGSSILSWSVTTNYIVTKITNLKVFGLIQRLARSGIKTVYFMLSLGHVLTLYSQLFVEFTAQKLSKDLACAFPNQISIWRIEPQTLFNFDRANVKNCLKSTLLQSLPM